MAAGAPAKSNEERPATFEQKSNEERPATFQQRLGDEKARERGRKGRMVHILLLQTGHYVFRNKSREECRFILSINTHLEEMIPRHPLEQPHPRAHTLFFLYQLIQRLLQNRGPHGAHVIAVVQHGVGDDGAGEPVAMQEAQDHCRMDIQALLGL